MAVAIMEINAELGMVPRRSHAAARRLALRRGPLPLVARNFGKIIPQVLICLVHWLAIFAVSLSTLVVSPSTHLQGSPIKVLVCLFHAFYIPTVSCSTLASYPGLTPEDLTGPAAGLLWAGLSSLFYLLMTRPSLSILQMDCKCGVLRSVRQPSYIMKYSRNRPTVEEASACLIAVWSWMWAPTLVGSYGSVPHDNETAFPLPL